MAIGKSKGLRIGQRLETFDSFSIWRNVLTHLWIWVWSSTAAGHGVSWNPSAKYLWRSPDKPSNMMPVTEISRFGKIKLSKWHIKSIIKTTTSQTASKPPWNHPHENWTNWIFLFRVPNLKFDWEKEQNGSNFPLWAKTVCKVFNDLKYRTAFNSTLTLSVVAKRDFCWWDCVATNIQIGFWLWDLVTGRFGGIIFDGKISQHQKSTTKSALQNVSASAACVQTCWHWRMSHLTVHSGGEIHRRIPSTTDRGHCITNPSNALLFSENSSKSPLICIVWSPHPPKKNGLSFNDWRKAGISMQTSHWYCCIDSTLTPWHPWRWPRKLRSLECQHSLRSPENLGVTTRKCQNQQAYKLSKLIFHLFFQVDFWFWGGAFGSCVWVLLFCLWMHQISSPKQRYAACAQVLELGDSQFQTADWLIFHADFLSGLHDSKKQRKRQRIGYMAIWHPYVHPTRNKTRKKLTYKLDTLPRKTWNQFCFIHVDPMSIQRSSCVSRRVTSGKMARLYCARRCLVAPFSASEVDIAGAQQTKQT